MQVTVYIFGQLAEITGKGAIEVNNIPDTDSLQTMLRRNYPGLQDIPYLVAVDKEVISLNTALRDRSEVALLPPYAGG